MSPFENLPYRLTRGIVELIPRDKLNRFDTVAVVDLQNLRLVSTRFDDIVTPILFKSLIWDHRFLRPKDIHRIIKFVNLFPHLARFVQDLLIRVPPDNTAPAIDNLAATRAFLRVSGISKAKHLTDLHEEMYYKVMVAPLQLWKSLAEDDITIGQRAIGRVYWQTFQRLPNLRHIETAVSTHYYESLAIASDIVAAKLNVYVENYNHNAIFSEVIALTSAYALTMASCPLYVKSLKFRQVPLMENVPEWCPIPTHIHDLHIEFEIPIDSLTEGDDQRLLGKAVREWREQFLTLPRLRSLFVDFRGNWDEVNNWPLLNECPFYIQNLLPRLSNDESGPAFPNLSALTLRNVPADPFALLDFVAVHRSTLKRLVLHRISLDIGPDMDWAQLGSQLAKCGPLLSFLDLWRIGTHLLGWYNERGEMVEEDNEDALQRMIAHQLLNDDEIELVYRNAGWWPEDVVFYEVQSTEKVEEGK